MSTENFRYRRVEQQILDLINAGTLKPGEKLPSLRKLSRQMAISVTTVHQAYLELEKKGVVSARERSGFVILPPHDRLPQPATRTRPNLIPTLGRRGALIQNVLETVGRDHLLPFGVAYPAQQLLPANVMARLWGRELRRAPSAGLVHAPVAGEARLRRQIAMRALDAGITTTSDAVLVTNGAMEGIAIALRVLTRPGDTVLIQSPSYFCFLQLLESYGLRAVEIPSTTDGIDPADVRRAVERFDIRAAILVPNFNNPDGSLTDTAAKRKIVDILAAEDIPLVEDDVYGDLSFIEPRPTTCKSFDTQGNVILCSSFSKTLAPGHRIGWMLAGRYFNRCMAVKTSTNICTATAPQLGIAGFLEEGHYDRHLRRLRQAVQGQVEALLPSLRRHFPAGSRASLPTGGAAVWVELPEGIDAVTLFHQARRNGIGIAPGPIFSTQEHYGNCIRLSCNGVWNEQMEEGIAVLGGLASALL